MLPAAGLHGPACDCRNRFGMFRNHPARFYQGRDRRLCLQVFGTVDSGKAVFHGLTETRNAVKTVGMTGPCLLLQLP